MNHSIIHRGANGRTLSLAALFMLTVFPAPIFADEDDPLAPPFAPRSESQSLETLHDLVREAMASSNRDPVAVAAVEAAMKLMRERKYRDALVEVNRALKIDVTFPEAYVVRGDVLRATEDYQGAAKAYTEALTFDQNSVAAYNGRGEALMAVGQFDDAIVDFRKAQELDPNNAAVLSNLGHLLVNKAGDATNGLRILSDAIALNGKDARAYRDRGLAHAQLRDFRKAVADMQKAAEIDPDGLEEDWSVAPALPPIDGGEVKVFRLRHADVAKTAETVQSLFGVSQMRVAVDDRTNSLVVLGKQGPLKVVEAVLTQMDQPAEITADKDAPKSAAAGKPADRSLLLRVFWLADGLPEDEGQDPANYLPKSVLQALDGLGLKAPRLVAQTVNAVAVGGKDRFNFSATEPAILLGQTATLNFNGSMRPIVADRAGLDIQLAVMGQIHCGLEGSLATPLDHFMVLGTANSLSADPAQVAKTPGGGMRGAMEVGPEGGVGLMEKTAQPKFNQARFAFVVQVIEATSYPAEK